MKSLRALVVASTFALLLVVILSPSVAASLAQGGFANAPAVALTHAQTSVSLAVAPVEEGVWALEARLRDGDAEPIGSQTVRFVAIVDFLGSRPMLLGSVPTDASGVARYTYRPTWSGTQHIVARVQFADGTLGSNEALLEVTGAQSPLAGSNPRLPLVGAWAGPVAAIVVAAVWGLLALIVVRVVVGISRAATVAAGPADGSGPHREVTEQVMRSRRP